LYWMHCIPAFLIYLGKGLFKHFTKSKISHMKFFYMAKELVCQHGGPTVNLPSRHRNLYLFGSRFLQCNGNHKNLVKPFLASSVSLVILDKQQTKWLCQHELERFFFMLISLFPVNPENKRAWSIYSSGQQHIEQSFY